MLTAPRVALPSLLIAGCVAATWFVWGSTYLAIKIALQGFPPFFQMGTRFLVAGALVLAWTRWQGRPWPDGRQWRHAFLLGALMLGGGMGGTAVAEQTVGSGLIVAFIAVVPMMMAALNLLWRIVPSRRESAGIAVGLVGVVMLTQGAGFQSSPAGLLAIITACVTWSVGSVLSQHRWPLAPGAVGYGSEMLCGGVVLMLLSALAGERLDGVPSLQAWLAWGYLVVAGSLIAFTAYMVLLDRASGPWVSSYTFVNPVIAMLLGVTLGGETVTPAEMVAVGVVLGGVLLLLPPRR